MELAKLTDSELAKSNELQQQIVDFDAPNFIMGLRIKNPTSQMGAVENIRPGNWVFAGKQDLGPNLKAVIGPWRPAARLFVGETCPSQSLNRCEGNKFGLNGKGNLEHVITRYTPTFQAILDKKVPDDQKNSISNRVGYDVLHWLPEFSLWAVYFCAGKSKPPTSTYMNVIQDNLNRVAMLSTERGPGKFHYYIPRALLTTEQAVWPQDYQEKFDMFLNTPLETDGEPAVER